MVEQRLRRAYAAFNARDIETVLSLMDPDVDWPNGMEGGRVVGQAAVREYWTRQFQQIDSHVVPMSFTVADDCRVIVRVHQIVRHVGGDVISDGTVVHTYRLRNSLVTHMEIDEG